MNYITCITVHSIDHYGRPMLEQLKLVVSAITSCTMFLIRYLLQYLIAPEIHVEVSMTDPTQ